MFDKALEKFLNYTENYKYLGKPISLKISHTLRVTRLCEQIAEALNLDSQNVEVAKLAGLFHDIGRFEQFKRYQTYADKNSLDHGDLGYEILKQNDFVNNKYKEIILNAVKYHNKYSLDGIDDQSKLICEIVRDADKIDILYLDTLDELITYNDNSLISDKVLEQIDRQEQVLHANLKTTADNIALHLSFVFDINFISSLKLIKEEKYITKIMDLYPNSKLQKQFTKIKTNIDTYIETREKDAR